MQIVEHIRRVHTRHYFKAQHTTGTLQSLGGKSLVTGPRQARVMNGLDQRMREQVPRDGIRILLLPVHAQGQCLDAAAHRIAFSGRQYPSKTVLGEVHAIGQILTGDDHETGVDVGVTGQVLGGGVDYHIRAKGKRLLQVRGHERVVHDGQCAVTMRRRGDGAYVIDLEQRIGQGFKVDGLGRRDAVRAVALDGGLQRCNVLGID